MYRSAVNGGITANKINVVKQKRNYKIGVVTMNEQKLIEWLESMPWWSKLPYAKLEEELAISMAYADKLAAGLPGGILPKDVEVLRKANHDFAEENAVLKRNMASLVERAERVQEGEDWNLAEFILRKAKEETKTVDEHASLKRENEKLQHVIDYIWQEIYMTDEPVLSVCSVEKLRKVALLTAEE